MPSAIRASGCVPALLFYAGALELMWADTPKADSDGLLAPGE